MNNVLTPLAKYVLLLFGLIVAASATNAPIQMKIYGSGMAALIMSNKEKKDMMKLVKSLEKSGLLIEVVSETIRNEVKEQKGGPLGMLFGKLGASLLGNLSAGKGVI